MRNHSSREGLMGEQTKHFPAHDHRHLREAVFLKQVQRIGYAHLWFDRDKRLFVRDHTVDAMK